MHIAVTSFITLAVLGWATSGEPTDSDYGDTHLYCRLAVECEDGVRGLHACEAGRITLSPVHRPPDPEFPRRVAEPPRGETTRCTPYLNPRPADPRITLAAHSDAPAERLTENPSPGVAPDACEWTDSDDNGVADDPGILKLLEQSRSVSASMSGAGTYSDSAPDFGPYSAVVEAIYAGEYWARGDQVSTLDSATIEAQGNVYCYNPFYTTECHSGDAASDCEVVFDLPYATYVALSVDLYTYFDHGGTNDGDAGASIELLESSGASVYTGLVDWWSPDLHVESTALLPPGAYTLSIHAFAWIWTDGTEAWPGIGGGGDAEYDIHLQMLPLPTLISSPGPD